MIFINSPICVPTFIQQFTGGMNFSAVKSRSQTENIVSYGTITFVEFLTNASTVMMCFSDTEVLSS